ncbi:DsbA family oxidoreductase [Novilysobacter defluvii]|uniref:DSBA oxidoreductase n=1 Tax=Lysobacter defluvii IMMIB APB-9 = DSM 18482 TaxID=1385515 RepID=A0A0A0MC02_9GAMM|nr:DsbA family oxidoreductase [Lysobacter defluvii]KGO99466.1 DSBA oxidoreductase [Lysobacter defluvii IMMIB APB-9 = DSM 18482]
MATTPDTPVRLRIDFVSDVVCPWCAVGLASLEQALERTRGEVEADLHFQPFELNPDMAPEGEDAVEHLRRKYGMPAAQLEANQQAIVERGAALGFTFDMERRQRIYNTFDAHRLLHWAETEGRQRELKHALLRAYFTGGRDVSDHGTLAEIAASAGLREEGAREVLESGAWADEVRIGERFFQSHGIRSVPAVILERKHLVSGGQPVEVFEQALRQVAALVRQGE